MKKKLLIKKQKQVALSLRAHFLIRSIATHEHRPISMQLELMAEQECLRLGIPIPKTNETEKEAL